jgi:hypothetical protein
MALHNNRWLFLFPQLSFDVGIATIFGGRLDERRKEELRRNYAVVEKGYNSFPNSFPGTLYYKAMQVIKQPKETARHATSRPAHTPTQ